MVMKFRNKSVILNIDVYILIFQKYKAANEKHAPQRFMHVGYLFMYASLIASSET